MKKELKQYQKRLIGLGFYIIMTVMILIPVWVPHSWIVVKEASPQPIVQTVYSDFWSIYLLFSIVILSLLGFMRLSNFSDWLVSRFWGRKPVDCWAQMIVRLMQEGITEDRAVSILHEWIEQYKIQERP